MAKRARKRPEGPRRVACTHCRKTTEVGQRAMSTVCPHCHKRLILEDYNVTSYIGLREFATTGDIVVEKSGQVVAGVKAGTLTVKGKVEGSVVVRGRVSVCASGTLKGDVQAPILHIEEGAMVSGFLRIGEAPAGKVRKSGG